MSVHLTDGSPTLSELGRGKHALEDSGGGNMSYRVREGEPCPR